MKTILKKQQWGTKITTLCLAVVFFAATGCEKNNDLNTNEFTPQANTAKVENASKYSNVVEVKLMVYDRTTSEIHDNVNVFTNHYVEIARSDWKDGSFTIVLPETLTSNYLYPLINNNSLPTTIVDIPSTMFVSDENVRITGAYFVGVDKDGNAVATFSPVKIDAAFFDENIVGDGIKDAYTEAVFTFVNSDVAISGYTEGWGNYILVADSDYPGRFKETTNYSVEWKKGWSIWFFSRSQTRKSDTMIITQQWTTTPVSGLKWHGSKENLHLFQN